MTFTVTINLWWPIAIIGTYYLVGLLLSSPMLLVALSYPRPQWRRTLVGWLLVAWLFPVMYAWGAAVQG